MNAPTSPASGALPADAIALHAAIMNIPVSHKVAQGLQGPPKGFYLLGHQDARTAAAELALAALASREASPTPVTITDAMVDAYLVAQRRTVEEADRFGRPNVGGLHTNTVREACRAGLEAAALASPQVAPALSLRTPLEGECRTVSGFLSDVMTAAGLVEQGKQSKALAYRMSKACAEIMGLVYRAAPAPVAPTLSLDEILNAYAKAAPEFDAVVLQSFVDAYPVHGPALLRYAQVQLTSRPASREEVEQEEIDDDQMATSVESLHAKMTALRSAGAPVAPTPAQPSEDARDAARYRWLMDSEWEMFDNAWLNQANLYGEGAKEFGEFIDSQTPLSLPTEPEGAPGKPWDTLTALEKAPKLVAELEAEAERITRYTNGPGDSLLNEAARVIEALSAGGAAPDEGEAIQNLLQSWDKLAASVTTSPWEEAYRQSRANAAQELRAALSAPKEKP